ncbi:MAG TPA: hypothetical protein VGL20_02660 [Candidatus Dormibacteraeota bacterium]
MSTTIALAGRSPVADLVLDHHRANFRPRVAVVAPLVPPLPAAPPRVSSAKPMTAVITPGAGAAVGQVLLIRFIACVVLWAVVGTVYGFWELGNALVPTDRHGEVTCVIPRAVGSIPGC